jgi:hypothetical protein
LGVHHDGHRDLRGASGKQPDGSGNSGRPGTGWRAGLGGAGRIGWVIVLLFAASPDRA